MNLAAAQPSRQIVLLLGGPGAGKSTQAQLLSRELHLPHVSTGDLLRERERGASLARMARGDLLPDDIVSEVVLERLAQPDAEHGAILDGFPRTLAQAEALDKWLERHNGSIQAAVYLDVPSDELIQRLEHRAPLSGRIDDQSSAIPRRLELFQEEVAPLLKHYADRDLLRRVDGSRAIDRVHRQIAHSLATPGASAH